MRDRPEQAANRTATDGSKRRKPSGKKRKPAKLSRLHKPEGMSLEDWQIELRRQFGREQDFRLKNVGDHPVFSEFEVANPQSRNAYRVRIRGPRLGDNYCSCPDFATNTLGTCKHIEFTLAALERKRGGAGRPAGRLPAAVQRGLPAIRRPARGPLPARRRLPARAGPARRRATSTIGRGAAAGGLRAASRSSWPRPAGSTTTCAAATTCWRSSPRCATPNAAASAWPRRSRAASAAPPSRTCSRSRSTTISARAPCSPPGPAAA